MATDNLGRDASNEKGQSFSFDVLAKSLLKNTGNVKEYAPTEQKTEQKTEQQLEKLYEAVNKVAERIDANASKDLEQSQVWVDSILSYLNENIGSKNKPIKDSSSDPAVAIQKSLQKSQEQDSNWIGISDISTKVKQDLADAFGMSDCCKALTKSSRLFGVLLRKLSKDITLPKPPHGSEDLLTKIVESLSSAKSAKTTNPVTKSNQSNQISIKGSSGFKGMDAIGKLGSAISYAVVGANKFLASLNLVPTEVFKSLVSDSMVFSESLRQIVHQQQGFGALNRDIEKSYLNLESNIYASGQTRAVFQEQYLKNLERGLPLLTREEKLQSKSLSNDKKELFLIKQRKNKLETIQTSALFTAKQLHMSSSSVNDLFMDWHMSLGLSVNNLSEMSRHMHDVSRETGVTGQRLESAMKSTQQIGKDLKKNGGASIDAMKNVSGFTVSAEKHGFDEGSQLLKDLSSRESYLASDQISLLTSSAQMAPDKVKAMTNLQTGTTLQDPEGLKNLAKGQEEFVKHLLQYYDPAIEKAGFGSAKELDIAGGGLEKLMNNMAQSDDPEQRQVFSNINTLLKNQGTDVGQITQLQKTIQDLPKPLEDQIKNLEKKATGQKGPELERINKLIKEKKTDQSLERFNKIQNVSPDLQKKNLRWKSRTK